MTVLGLTGGIGTGKSTVATLLRRLGVPVIDADQVARDVVEPGKPALAAIVAAFGSSVLTPQGTLDRAAMRRRISHDGDARKTLERITHPAIAGAIAEELQRLQGEGRARAVVEAALMVETGSYRLYGDIIVVTCSPDVQLARVMSRDGVSEEDARALIASQLPLAEKEAVARYVIRNNEGLDELERQTREIWDQIRG